MKILVLIISDNSLPHYRHNKDIWLSYMNKYSNIDSFFMEYTKNDHHIFPYINQNTIYFNGEESMDNLLIKTLDSMEYFINSNIHYDYILRTNLSTICDFDKLQEYLISVPNNQLYAGSSMPYYHLIEHYYWFNFIGGMAIIMSNDICKLLLENRNIAESFKNVDDIDIGYTFHLLNIKNSNINLCIINSFSNFEKQKNIIINKEYIFYRSKSILDDRSDEPLYMKEIVNLIYPFTLLIDKQ